MIVLSFVLSLVCAFPLMAQTNWESALRERGYIELTKESRSGRVQYLAQGPNKPRFTIDVSGELQTTESQLIMELYDRLAIWESLVPSAYSFTVDGNQIRLHILPSRFMDGTSNLLPYTPGGLSFTSSGVGIDYDFRLKVDTYFIRFQGIYVGERLLLDRLKTAVEDPAQFIRDNDPSYSAFRIAEIQGDIINLGGRLDVTDSNTRELQRSLAAAYERIEALEKETARLAEENKKQEELALLAIQELNTRFDQELQRYADEIDARFAQTDAVNDINAMATAAALSKGLFGGSTLIPVEIRDRILSIKAENPAATVEEILADLKARDLKASKKQVQAILMVYLGE